jgi:SSS family solute:Na+ symporter
MGRWVTVGGTVAAVGTAFIASRYENLMDYLQQLFSFFNAPLFATFLLGMFWKRMTPTAGWLGLVLGTASAIVVYGMSSAKVFELSDQGASFVGAGAAFVVDIAVSVVVSLATRPKAEAELVGLVYSLTPRESLRASTTGEDAGWYRRPGLLAAIVLVITIVLNLVFA